MNISPDDESKDCCDRTRLNFSGELVHQPCCTPLDVDRRSFIRLVGLAGAAALARPMPVMAGPFDNPNFDVNIPADKNLHPDWLKSLFERGVPEVYSGDLLDAIRMPIGGIGAGHVDLSGEGGLMKWFLFDRAFPLDQGFALRTVSNGQSAVWRLNRHDFPKVTFRGEYPLARIEYAAKAVPVQVSLEAFSPFIPLNADDSGLPATFLNFTLKNISGLPVEATLGGWLENGICRYSRFGIRGTRRNRITRKAGLTVLNCTAEPAPADRETPQPDITFEDWTAQTFVGWTAEGSAFSPGPVDWPVPRKNPGESGLRVARAQKNGGASKLTSAPFVISRRYVNVWIGGNIAGKTCVNLLVQDQPVQSLTGPGDVNLSPMYFDVSTLEGKHARLEIVDASENGDITAGRIWFSDIAGDGTPMAKLQDAGSMALALLGAPAELGIAKGSPGLDGQTSDDASVPLLEKLTGVLGRTVHLQPGETVTMTFIVSWHFPNLTLDKLGAVGRSYSRRFDSARAVAEYLTANFKRLAAGTRLWRDTWYDSTLPYWFLDRTLLNVSTLATSGCYRFADGRFYAWEGGPGCCPGTCTHVWQYAHSMARVFPELERDTRERVDLGLARNPTTGVIGFRAEFDHGLAVDGQAGTILRIYREHQMSRDSGFLKRNWENIKRVYAPLFALDGNADGIMEGAQMNTLDRAWYGQIAWLSSMYIAALRAGEQMATEMGDTNFRVRCGKIAATGTKNLTDRLFNGEYFFNIVDPKHIDTVNSGQGCYIDQVYGQSWAYQVGLPTRIVPEREARIALQNLWKYNFSPDAGAYFKAHKSGRRFVRAGDAGLIMCTFPRTDWDYTKASGGDIKRGAFAYYFNETWTGNEYQVASHMLWERMAQEGMAVVRAIHDRYHPSRRNPWNEVECGDHYSRAMASHSVFIAACGYEYHGPLGHIGFAPKLSPENFRAPFTAAEGWGTYAQTIVAGKMEASIEVRMGRLRLRTMSLEMDAGRSAPNAKVTLSSVSMPVSCNKTGNRLQLTFSADAVVPEGQKLIVEIT